MMGFKRSFVFRIYVVLVALSLSRSLVVFPDFEYVIYESNTCHSDAPLLTKILGVPLSSCVKECAGRQHCAGVSYKRGGYICDLLSTLQAEVMFGPCDYIRRSDIVVKKQSPISPTTPEQACDLSSGACAIKECLFPVIANGRYLGNRNSIGHRLGVMCDHGYSRTNTETYITCGVDGQWSPIISNLGSATGDMYKGNVNVTHTGRTCQAWSAQSPHGHYYVDGSKYPEGSLDAASNYCRDPDNHGKPWCYTTDPYTRWEECFQDICVLNNCK